MDSRRIQQDVGAVKQEQLRKIEVGSGVKPKLKGSLIREYIRDIEGRTGRKLDKLQVENLKDALRKKITHLLQKSKQGSIDESLIK